MGAPGRDEGTFSGCEYIPGNEQHAAHLAVFIKHGNKSYTAIYWHSSGVILRRVEASLKDRAGLSMFQTGEVELFPPRSS